VRTSDHPSTSQNFSNEFITGIITDLVTKTGTATLIFIKMAHLSSNMNSLPIIGAFPIIMPPKQPRAQRPGVLALTIQTTNLDLDDESSCSAALDECDSIQASATDLVMKAMWPGSSSNPKPSKHDERTLHLHDNTATVQEHYSAPIPPKHFHEIPPKPQLPRSRAHLARTSPPK